MDLMVVAHKREVMLRDDADEQQKQQWQERLTQLEGRLAVVMLTERNCPLQIENAI